MPEITENHVTLAVLGEKIDNLEEKIDSFLSGQAKLEERVRGVESKSTEHEQKLSAWATFQGVFSVIVAAIAAVIGTRN